MITFLLLVAFIAIAMIVGIIFGFITILPFLDVIIAVIILAVIIKKVFFKKKP